MLIFINNTDTNPCSVRQQSIILGLPKYSIINYLEIRILSLQF